MKRTLLLIITMFVLVSTCFASELPEQPSSKTTISILYSDTTLDTDIKTKQLAKKQILGSTIENFSTKYNMLLDDKHIQILNESGTQEISTVERRDIISSFSDAPTDYIVIIDVLPLTALSVWNYAPYAYMTTMQLKIIDVKSDKYLYNGKVFYKPKASASLKGCYGELNKQLNTILSKYFPLN
ncbi:hypothetical protein [Anaerospora hongkongensis]|uniref:hypothetical protein n=1 Tax=Anaerospora hongkongensis TaxID=244830 RepID=UPI00289679AC|nr:hypothetical protein [Anaerospora hongkongensis]